MNAVITQGKPVGESILQGEGAGPGPIIFTYQIYCQYYEKVKINLLVLLNKRKK